MNKMTVEQINEEIKDLRMRVRSPHLPKEIREVYNDTIRELHRELERICPRMTLNYEKRD